MKYNIKGKEFCFSGLSYIKNNYSEGSGFVQYPNIQIDDYFIATSGKWCGEECIKIHYTKYNSFTFLVSELERTGQLTEKDLNINYEIY